MHVTGNTFARNPRLFVLGGTPASHTGSFRNNVITGAELLLDVEPSALERACCAKLGFARNLVWNSERGSLLTGELLVRDSIELEKPDLDGDPRFVDPATGDYRLAADSPAIDAGVAPGPYRWWWFFDQDESVQPAAEDVRAPVDGGGDGIDEFDLGAFEYRPRGRPVRKRPDASCTSLPARCGARPTGATMTG